MKYFVLIVLLSITIGILTNSFLKIDEILIESLSFNLTSSQINEYLELKKKWEWITYCIIPITLLIKTTFVASVLYVGVFFYSKVKINFYQLWQLVIKAEVIFLFVGIVNIIWFSFYQINYNIEDIQYFYPLSALNIVGYQGLEPWFIYPLQVLNLFELAYWLVLAYFIGKLAFTEKDKGKPMDLGLKIVASSYGSALLLWVVVVMFFTLNYS